VASIDRVDSGVSPTRRLYYVFLTVTPILVATDFSRFSDRALEEAITLARALNAPLELAHIHEMSALPVPPALDLAATPPPPERVARAEVALVDAAVKTKAAGVACDTFATFGRPAEEIVKRARALGARMLVVGTRGHGSVKALLVGSVAERIVKDAPCPVLVVP
jgi:nucleotide-binding universal stress UspA family protein